MAAAKPDSTIRTPPDDPEHQEELLDEAIDETFPASDPVSISIEPAERTPRPDEPKQPR
jgi:hypothetical protein